MWASRSAGEQKLAQRAARLFLKKDKADAKRLFGFSILYLFALFAALAVDRFVE